jgi:2-dehydro-3-deoxygluconokinase
MTSLDLITIGEALLRLSVPPETLLAEASSFQVQIAGAESNVAVAVSRMGYRTRWLSRLTDNVLGRRITRELASYGVDCSQVVWTNDDRVGTYYLEFGAQPRPTQVIYDRAHSAASKMRADTFDTSQLSETRILHLTGITPALSDGCYDLIASWIDHARQQGVTVIFDVNFRALLWSPDECAAKLTPLLEKVDMLICGQSDAATVFGIQGEQEALLRALQQRFGVRRVAMTVGEAGAIGLDNSTIHNVEGYPVEIVDRIGAGDAFAAGVICGLLEDSFELGIRYGVAMSALQLTLSGDLFRLGRGDVMRLMESGITKRPLR